MYDKKISALINLLEDPDPEVYDVVSRELQERGVSAIPNLEKVWESSLDQNLQEKIEDLIQLIQFNYVKAEFRQWLNNGAEDLLYGAYLVARYQYPELYFSEIEEQVEILRKDAWIELNENLTALEKIRVLNHVFFAMHKFTRNTVNFYSPRNSFINQILETKKANPISIAVLYSHVARKLDMPVYGVNLPLNYILAYKDPFFEDDPDGILFYINPYNRGTVLSKKDISRFLKQQKLEPKAGYFIPCNNVTTIKRMLKNLVFSYEKLGYTDKTEQIKILLDILADK